MEANAALFPVCRIVSAPPPKLELAQRSSMTAPGFALVQLILM
jgi:hypothetical protein